MCGMSVEIITKEDLQVFRMQLLSDLREMFQVADKVHPDKPWLKNAEVMKLLKVSANTIQRLRIAGKLKASKVGGVHYYRYEDIEKLLNSNGI